MLPSKPNAAGAWIVVRSSNLSALPAGGRVNPSQASAMAKIVTGDVSPAIATQAGANFWRLTGLEITMAETALPNATVQGAATNYGLISLGSDAETNADNCRRIWSLTAATSTGCPRRTCGAESR